MLTSLRGGEMTIKCFMYLEFGIRRHSLTRLKKELVKCLFQVFSCWIVELGSNKMLRFIITWQTILEANRSALVGYIYVGVVQCVVKWNRSSCCCCFFFRCGKIVIFFLSGKIGTLKKTYFFDQILRGFFVVFLFFSFFFLFFCPFFYFWSHYFPFLL